MRAVIQRVTEASVEVEGKLVGEIAQGLLILVGVGPEDTAADIDWLAQKLLNMRIFADDAGKMNLSVQDVKGGLLVVSQFTLWADTRKGNRPSFIGAAPPAMAESLYLQLVDRLRSLYAGHIATGIFGADMKIRLLNDGPVTITMDSQQRG